MPLERTEVLKPWAYLTLGNHSASNPGLLTLRSICLVRRTSQCKQEQPRRAITNSLLQSLQSCHENLSFWLASWDRDGYSGDSMCSTKSGKCFNKLKYPPHLTDVHFVWIHDLRRSQESCHGSYHILCIRLQLLRPRLPCLKFTWSYRFYITRHQNQARHLWEWGSKARKRGPGIPKSQGNYTLPHCLDSCRNFSLLMIPKLQFCNLITCYNLSREDMELMEKITKKITKKRQPTNFSYKKPGTVSHCWQWRPAKQVDLEGRILTPLIHGITVTILLYPTKNPKCILL